jgi:class 3 adenylate cyclase
VRRFEVPGPDAAIYLQVDTLLPEVERFVAALSLGLEVRAGLHTGECEQVGEKLGRLAVNIGARVASQAQPGEVLVSSTVKDLVAGSGIAFEDRGLHTLKGIPGKWRLFAVAEATTTPA